MALTVRRQAVRRTTLGRQHPNITHLSRATTDEIYEIKCQSTPRVYIKCALLRSSLTDSVRDHFSTCPRLGISPPSNQSVMDFLATPLMPAPSIPAPDELRCKYPSKVCENVRAIKRDGELHRFCDFHRLKANMNQRRLDRRRREARTGKLNGYIPGPQFEHDAILMESEVVSLPSLDWNDVDLVILNDLLLSGSNTVEECEAALFDINSATEVMSMSINW